MAMSTTSNARIQEAVCRIGKETRGLFSALESLDNESESEPVGGSEIDGATIGKPAEHPKDEVSLTKSQIFDLALQLVAKGGGSIDQRVNDILRAIKTVNEAQLVA